MRTFVLLLAAAAVGCLAGVFGATSMVETARALRQELLPVRHPPSSDAFYNRLDQLVGYHDKQEVPRPAITPRTIVAFTFGQSNAGNFGGAKFSARSPDVLNFWDGRFWRGDDPLLGAGGRAGSPWVLMANDLLERRAADRIILIAAAVNASTAAEWAPRGRLNGMLRQRLAEVRDAGLVITHFLWHQGEQDYGRGTDLEFYRGSVAAIIALTKVQFPQSKFFVARATICDRLPAPGGALRQVQTDMARLPGVYLGPDTDTIGFNDRYDDCHMAPGGLEKHAAGWAAAIVEQRR